MACRMEQRPQKHVSHSLRHLVLKVKENAPTLHSSAVRAAQNAGGVSSAAVHCTFSTNRVVIEEVMVVELMDCPSHFPHRTGQSIIVAVAKNGTKQVHSLRSPPLNSLVSQPGRSFSKHVRGTCDVVVVVV